MGTEPNGNAYINACGNPGIAYRKISEWCTENNRIRFMYQDVKHLGVRWSDMQRLQGISGIEKVGTEKIRTRNGLVTQNKYRLVYIRPSKKQVTSVSMRQPQSPER